jgi:hypothetical protein
MKNKNRVVKALLDSLEFLGIEEVQRVTCNVGCVWLTDQHGTDWYIGIDKTAVPVDWGGIK